MFLQIGLKYLNKIVFRRYANNMNMVCGGGRLVSRVGSGPRDPGDSFLLPKNIFFTTYSQPAILFLPTTLCRGVIRTHVELHQTGNFEGRSTD